MLSNGDQLACALVAACLCCGLSRPKSRLVLCICFFPQFKCTCYHFCLAQIYSGRTSLRPNGKIRYVPKPVTRSSPTRHGLIDLRGGQLFLQTGIFETNSPRAGRTANSRHRISTRSCTGETIGFEREAFVFGPKSSYTMTSRAAFVQSRAPLCPLELCASASRFTFLHDSRTAAGSSSFSVQPSLSPTLLFL